MFIFESFVKAFLRLTTHIPTLSSLPYHNPGFESRAALELIETCCGGCSMPLGAPHHVPAYYSLADSHFAELLL